MSAPSQNQVLAARNEKSSSRQNIAEKNLGRSEEISLHTLRRRAYLRRIMITIVVTVGALFAFVLTMRVLTRWTARSVSRLDQLGTVSHQWLALHRAEDK